jgi:hypothetical protein
MRARVQNKNELGFGNDDVQLSFVADYEDGRNEEWAQFTPSLTFTMTVKKEIAAMFEVGEKITFFAEPTQAPEEEGGSKTGGNSE